MVSFFIGTPTTKKLDDGIPVMHFLDFKYRYSKRYSQTTSKFDDGISVRCFSGL